MHHTQLMLPAGAARAAGIDPAQLSRWIKAGKVATLSLADGTVVIPLREVERLTQDRRPRGRPPKQRGSGAAVRRLIEAAMG